MATHSARTMKAKAARLRLRLDRVANPRRRVVSTACWNFPIHSQTFVYEEQTQLLRAGFAVRLFYSEEEPRSELGGRFDELWGARQNVWLDREQAAADIDWFGWRFPDRVNRILQQVSDASGIAVSELLRHEHVRLAFSFARAARAYRPHYLHSYFFYEGTLFTFVAAQLLGVPRGVSCYADHVLQDYSLKVVPLHLATCDVVVATSERIRAELLALHPDPGLDNVLVKPNGIDVHRFPVVARHQPRPGEPFRVVTVCRLEPKKGLLDLIEAAAILIRRGVVLQVHIVGADDTHSSASRAYAERIRSRTEEMGLTGVVRFEGQRSQPEVLRFLHDSHAFVAPFVELESGDKDGIPTVLLEAMSTGLPVVATDAGSMTEVIEDGSNGLVVSQRDPVALADGIGVLSSSPDRRTVIGRRAAESIRERFDARTGDRVLHERISRVLANRPYPAHR